MDERIEKALKYIDDNLNRTLCLKELASIACLSPSQFHRNFKKELSKTPFQYIEELKLNRAYELLMNGTDTVYALTLIFGYNDYETFSRAFKKKFKLSPDDLRSISLKLQEKLTGIKKDQIIIAAVESEDEGIILKKVEELIKRKNVSGEYLRQSKVFKITKKTGCQSKNRVLIKNKYELKEYDKIKKALRAK